MKEAVSIYKKGWRLLLPYAYSSACIGGICLTPLLFLLQAQTKPLAFLCIPLWLLLMLPYRQNCAAFLTALVRDGSAPLYLLADTENYGQKLLAGIKTLLCVLVWAIPAIAASCVLAYAYAGGVDAFTVMRYVMQLGGGNLMTGAAVVAALYALCLLPLFAGCAFHAPGRFRRAAKLPKPSRRGGMMLRWLYSGVTVLPFAAALACMLAGYVPQLVNALMSMSTAGLPAPESALFGMLACALVLLVPLQPLGEIMQCLKDTEDCHAS